MLFLSITMFSASVFRFSGCDFLSLSLLAHLLFRRWRSNFYWWHNYHQLVYQPLMLSSLGNGPCHVSPSTNHIPAVFQFPTRVHFIVVRTVPTKTIKSARCLSNIYAQFFSTLLPSQRPVVIEVIGKSPPQLILIG